VRCRTVDGAAEFFAQCGGSSCEGFGGQICKSPEEYKAWSQNLGHENVLTTFSSYGDVALHRQAEIIRGLGRLSIASRFGDPDRQAVARI
jgi:hypothetical protein